MNRDSDPAIDPFAPPPAGDSVIWMLAALYRRKWLCLVVIVAVVLVNLTRLPEVHRFKTVAGLRLVSPCVSYTQRDYWGPSSTVWLSQLRLRAPEFERNSTRISIRLDEEDWLLILEVDHNKPNEGKAALVSLIEQTNRQLSIKGGDSEHNANEQIANLNSSIPAPESLLTQFRGLLIEIERGLSAQENSNGGLPVTALSGRPPEQGRTFESPILVTTTSSQVPIETVPYYPWFESLHYRLSATLSDSARSAKDEPQQLNHDLKAMAEKLEDAAVLLSRVRVSMNPNKPVQELPMAKTESLVEYPEQSITHFNQNIKLGLFFGLTVAVSVVFIAEWISGHWGQIVGSRRPEGSTVKSDG
jgi:hypothetical protein